MNDQKIRDMVMDAIQHQVIKCGGLALLRATGTPEDWAATPDQALPLEQARMLAALQRLAGSDPTAEVLDQTWMEGERRTATEFLNHVFDQFTFWAMTERPDLLKTGREIINDALPPEERI